MKKLTSKQKRAIAAALRFYMAGYAARRGVAQIYNDLLDVKWESEDELNPVEWAKLVEKFE